MFVFDRSLGNTIQKTPVWKTTQTFGLQIKCYALMISIQRFLL